MKFLDWLNDNPWLLFVGGLILVLFFSCSTPQTTVDLQTKADQVEKAIDKGQDGCKSLECQDAMRRSKDYIRDSMDTVKMKDSQIKDLQDEKEDLKNKHAKELAKKDSIIADKDELIARLLKELIPWRQIKHYFWQTVWICLGILVLYIFWKFRSGIWTLIKTGLKLA